MRIRIKRDFSYEDRSYQAGTVANVSQEKGNRWCSHGLAMEDKSVDIPEIKADKSLVCSVCGKECKSAFGLQSHMRTHK